MFDSISHKKFPYFESYYQYKIKFSICKTLEVKEKKDKSGELLKVQTHKVCSIKRGGNMEQRYTIVLLIMMSCFIGISIGGRSVNVLCITHEDIETPATIKDWAERKGYTFNFCKPYAGQNCLIIDDFDMLIIMGGPQSAREYASVSYLADEVRLIQRAISLNKIIIGFCLGVQLIGEALGAKTERSPEKEIGVYPLTLVPESLHDPVLKKLPLTFPAIHWHYDMPGLTQTCQVLGYSQGCPRQIIKYGSRIYGFQCHLEMTKEDMRIMIQECPEDLTNNIYVQSAEEMLMHDYEAINQTMFKILDAMSAL